MATVGRWTVERPGPVQRVILRAPPSQHRDPPPPASPPEGRKRGAAAVVFQRKVTGTQSPNRQRGAGWWSCLTPRPDPQTLSMTLC